MEYTEKNILFEMQVKLQIQTIVSTVQQILTPFVYSYDIHK